MKAMWDMRFIERKVLQLHSKHTNIGLTCVYGICFY